MEARPEETGGERERERERAEVLEAHFLVKNRETARRELSSAVRSSAKWGG